MKVKIEEGCISCGFCMDTCPDVFFMNDSGLSEIQKQPTPENEDSAKEAAEGCPVNVIIIE